MICFSEEVLRGEHGRLPSVKTLASLQDGVSILDQSHSEASSRNKYCRLAANDRQPPDSYSGRFQLAIAGELNAVEEKMK
jgi:hypothetical protein